MTPQKWVKKGLIYKPSGERLVGSNTRFGSYGGRNGSEEFGEFISERETK